MGCNCGGGARGRATIYRLVLPNGVMRDYPTRQEAEAARQRSGGTVLVVNQ
ncbi:hypothetical protein [Streptomyces sp. TS71-3]|uniref:DUF7196 family protein n=1 Tax=Streptomyces sp. TS71-3 TaxID=2733862 RepID=UPI001B2618C2|nr:hypothetical protein [Streptomyces sp. TS71-3]GHJ36615.1 hypothetical protein Sm713_22240 [Streptomyces sp. TS71-3]